MLYSIYHNAIVDISDYVNYISDIPAHSRNEDYSLIAEGYNFKLSKNIPSLPVKGDAITFYRGDEIIHLGYISKIKDDEDDTLCVVYVSNILEKLKLYQTDDDFKTIMNDYDTIKSINAHDTEVISFNNLIAAILSAIGITIDWSLYVEKTDYSATGYTGNGYYTFTQEGVPTFGENDIFFLPNQIICMNQAKCWHPSYLNSDEGNRNRVNLFDLLSHLFSMVGYTIKPKTDNSIYILNVKEDYLFNDDNVIEYEDEDVDPQSTGLSLSYTTLKIHVGKFIPGTPPSIIPYWFPWGANQAYYYDSDGQYNGDPNDVAEYVYNFNSSSDDSASLTWYNNFNPIVLHWDGGTSTHFYWLVEPLFAGRSFPVMYLGDWKLLAYKKIITTILASEIFPIENCKALSIKVVDINNDLIKVEYIE